MADRTAARNRRRRMWLIAGGAVATAGVAAVVAAAVVNANTSDDDPQSLPSAESLPAEPQQPDPTFSDVSVPPPPDPREFISSKEKDTAPLSAAKLFPNKKLTKPGRTYVRTNTARTTSCSSAAASTLSSALASNGCNQVFRATYAGGDVAVTIGVAVFDSKAQADKAKNTAQYIRPLNGGGIADFCRAVTCRMTANSIGRYAYFTISGLKSNKPITASDTEAKQAAADVARATFDRIYERGRAAANAAVATASPNAN
ncbi:hypothetical protein [Streptomyces sp. KR80]|uniref:hypothetical protein n=1 Tax=Streptomyces sp. KR80 TaxID=3457426 RepID=UPI003FD1712E